MYENYNKTRKKVNEYEKLGSQTRGSYAAYDKGESGLLTTKNQTKAPTPPLRKNNYSEDSLFGLGSLAKSKLNSALRELYPDNRYKGLFDGIDDKAVEKNLSLADDVIAKNSANPYNKALFPKLPNLRGGLATYYAAAESGKHKAADMARKLAYTEATEQPLPDVAKTAKTQTSNKRYVNADLGLNLRSEPGTSKQIIGKLSKGTEVEFTGNKTGKIGNHEWAEIKYGDKTGWVAADYLNLEMPYDMYVPDRTDNSKSEMPQQEKSDAQTNNNGAGTRYVGEKTINMRATPGLRGHTKEKIDHGQSVEYTGNNETLDGIKWAEVKYGNKTGWVIADNLRKEPVGELFDPNAPKELIVKGQQLDAQARSDDLYQKTLEWVINDIIYDNYGNVRYDLDDAKQLIFQWLESRKPPQIIYTGPYCVPVRKVRINQGFYGLNSHAGKKERYETGHLGAIDFQAPPGTSVYSVLGGKVVYTYEEAPKDKGVDMHRVTVETKINGDTYYLEYLHMDSVDVIKGQTLHAGTQLGKSGGWGREKSDDFPVHLDFRVYKFKDDNQKLFYSDSAKQFFDPLEFFDFDVQFEYNMSHHDYH